MARGAVPNPRDTKAAREARAIRRAEACRLSVAGWSYAKIVRERPDLGYNNTQAVYRDVNAALEESIKQQDASAEVKRARELKVIARALREANRVIDSEHVATAGGRIVQREVEQPDGSVQLVDVIDQGPNLKAAETLVRISESRRKLLGLDAPVKTEQASSGTIEYKITTVGPDELEQL